MLVAVIGLMLGAVNTMGAPAPVVTITPLLMPPISSPDWLASADAVIADVKVGALKETGVGYAQCQGKMSWSNLVYSPVSPYGGPVVWNLVAVYSATGNDDVSMDMLSFTAKSEVDGGILGDTVTFGGLAYTPRAVAVKADGTVISSGPTSQKGKTVYVLVSTKLFNGGDTEAGLNQVRAYVESMGNYVLSYTAQVIGDDSTRSTAKISTQGTVTPTAPRLQMSRSATGEVTIQLLGAEPLRSYRLLAESNIIIGNWQTVAILSDGEVYQVPLVGTQQFYKAQVQ